MGHIDLAYITISLIHLNAVTLSDLNSLTLSLTLPLVYKLDYVQKTIFHALMDSKSTYYFINTIFMLKYNIPTNLTSFVKLKLFDRLLNNIISKTAFLSITFLSSDQMILNVYIMSLNSSYLLVLGYN